MRIAPASTLPEGPDFAAVTPTSLVVHRTRMFGGLPEIPATARNTASSSSNPMPLRVDTTAPDGIVYADDGSQFVNRTRPVALFRTTLVPVAGNSAETVTGTSTVVAGMTPASGSTTVAAGLAVTVNEMGPIGSIRGVTVISAVGRTVTAATAPAPSSSSARTPTSTTRLLIPRVGRSSRTDRTAPTGATPAASRGTPGAP